MCSEKARVINEILEVHRRISSIQVQKIEALVAGDAIAEAPLHRELNEARELRGILMDELKRHIETHRC